MAYPTARVLRPYPSPILPSSIVAVAAEVEADHRELSELYGLTTAPNDGISIGNDDGGVGGSMDNESEPTHAGVVGDDAPTLTLLQIVGKLAAQWQEEVAA